MSTSGAVKIVGLKNTAVYLYKHSDGPSLPDAVVHGLRSGRSTDGEYLARIIFEQMLTRSLSKETGYGISATEPGTSLPLIEVNPFAGTVALVFSDGKDPYAETAPAIPFAEFVAAWTAARSECIELPDNPTDEQRGNYYTLIPLAREMRALASVAV